MNLSDHQTRANKEISFDQKKFSDKSKTYRAFRTTLKNFENVVPLFSCKNNKDSYRLYKQTRNRQILRIHNYKTLPCCDPALAPRKPCPYKEKCSYAHPGEPLRKNFVRPYSDEEYFEELRKEFPFDAYPFGVYL